MTAENSESTSATRTPRRCGEGDSRMHGRRVRVLALHENQDQTVLQRRHRPKLGGEPRSFLVPSLDGRGHPIGSRTRVSAHSLHTRFRKIEINA